MVAFFVSLAFFLASSGFALQLASNQWATEHEWLIRCFWIGAGVSILVAIGLTLTHWVRGRFKSQRGEETIQQDLRANANAAAIGSITTGHGSVTVNLHREQHRPSPFPTPAVSPIGCRSETRPAPAPHRHR